VVAKLRTAYDQSWNEVQPLLVNESVVGPQMNPFKELYWKQFGVEPNARLLERVNPRRKSPADAPAKGGKKERRKNRKEQ
jgi:arylsulfatase